MHHLQACVGTDGATVWNGVRARDAVPAMAGRALARVCVAVRMTVVLPVHRAFQRATCACLRRYARAAGAGRVASVARFAAAVQASAASVKGTPMPPDLP